MIYMDNNKEKAQLLIDYLHRIAFYHVFWFTEIEHQLGENKAYSALKDVYSQSYKIFIDRFARTLGFDIEDGIPLPLLKIDEEQLDSLIKSIGTNWLANDGVWFQTVEAERGMNDAKRCNDSCWSRFSPFEAYSIKNLLKLENQPGLDGLAKALNYRLYSVINKQTVKRRKNTVILEMNDCRVQSARKRKNLPDYPCKSAGIVEYTRFAETIDKRIKTEVIACPPDDHPEDYFCTWRFVCTDCEK